jgi:hypothetical protein
MVDGGTEGFKARAPCAARLTHVRVLARMLLTHARSCVRARRAMRA